MGLCIFHGYFQVSLLQYNFVIIGYIVSCGIRLKPKGNIENYRVWASSQGFAFSRKPEEEVPVKETQEKK